MKLSELEKEMMSDSEIREAYDDLVSENRLTRTMEYRGYVGSVEFSEEDAVFFGKVQGIRSLVSYEGTTREELESDFHNAVDDYLSSFEELKR